MKDRAFFLITFSILICYCYSQTISQRVNSNGIYPGKSIGALPPQRRDFFPHAKQQDTKIVLYRTPYGEKDGDRTNIKHVPSEKDQMDLFTRHGASYHGQVHEDILPTYHIVLVNETTEDLFDYMKNKFGANWISPQIKMKRPLRSEVSDLFSSVKDNHKKNVFKSILKRSFPKAHFLENDEDIGFNKREEAMGRRNIENYQYYIHNAKTEYERRMFTNFQTRKKKFDIDQKPWEIVKDPLFSDQWHIHGNKYRRFSFESSYKEEASPTFNLNIGPVWYNKIAGRETRILGKGVVICVVGDGINYFHSDFNGKFIPDLSVDVTTDYFVSMQEYSAGLYGPDGDLIFTPYSPETLRGTNRTDYGMCLLSQTHGTSVASIAAGSADDGSCGSGIAPNSLVSSVRLLGDTNEVTPLEESIALSYKCAVFLQDGKSRGRENMIYVNSWGPSDGVSSLPVPMSEVTKDAIRGCSEIGRKGYGSIYIQAAGNGRSGGDTVDIDGYASYRYIVSVGSISYSGYPTTYTEGGESLMVVAPSSQGHMGITTATTVASFYGTRASVLKKFINQGRSETSIGGKKINIHQAYSSPLSDGCTSSFGGTSASAPMIAGLVALMLEANPTLTWKDVHDILIRSSEKPHLTYSRESFDYRYNMIRSLIGSNTLLVDMKPSNDFRGEYLTQKVQENFYIFFEPPDLMEWIVNKETGLHHSFLLGFGLPNGEKAVNMARSRLLNSQKRSIQDDYRILVKSEEIIFPKRFWYTLNKNEKNMENADPESQFIIDSDLPISGDNNTVSYKEVAVWYIELDENNLIDLQNRTERLYDNRNNLPLVDPLLGNSESHDKIPDMKIEKIELHLNASFPASIDNVQLALCDHQKVCSILLKGKDYDDTTIKPESIDYTFTTVKHWGQRIGNTMRPGQGWTIMLRNNYPFRYSKVVVNSMELRFYGHFSGET